MVVDDDHVDTERPGLRKRLHRGRAAVDRDQQRGAASGEGAHGLYIRAIAFEQAVGNVDHGIDAGVAQKAREQRGRRCAVNIVVAEDRHLLAAHDRVGDASRRLRHGGEHVRIGHRSPDRRVEERLDRIDFDIAAGEDAREQLGEVVPLRYRKRARRSALVEPAAPSAPGRRAFDAEEDCVVQSRPA
jgi:hypothetical protein